MSHQQTPPMPVSIRDDVEMGLNKVPVEYRNDMRYLIRRAAAVVWNEGYWQAHREAGADAYDREKADREAYPARFAAAKALADAQEPLDALGTAFVKLERDPQGPKYRAEVVRADLVVLKHPSDGSEQVYPGAGAAA